MDDSKSLPSVIKRIWEDLEADDKIDLETALAILKAESEHQEDPAKAKQAVTVLLETKLSKGGK